MRRSGTAGMHPAIRIVDCLLLIVMLASGLPLAFFLAAIIITGLLLLSYRCQCFPDITAIWRLRWLFASILFLYLLFPPVAGGSWQQQLTAGVAEAGMRIGALIAIVLLVQILFAMTDRRSVLAGLLWLLQPLARVGLPVERFALRLMLVMEIVPRAQDLLRQHHDNEQVSGGRIQKLVQRLTAAYARVIHEAENTPRDRIQLPVLHAPAVHEWLSPCLLAGLMIGLTVAT